VSEIQSLLKLSVLLQIIFSPSSC